MFRMITVEAQSDKSETRPPMPQRSKPKSSGEDHRFKAKVGNTAPGSSEEIDGNSSL